MLMRALDEGGVPAHRDHSRDDRARSEALPSNPHGFYEAPQGTLTDPMFPSIVPDGHAIKVFLSDVEKFVARIATAPTVTTPFRVAVLRRDPQAIFASYTAMFGRQPPPGTFTPLRYQMAVGRAVEVLKRSVAVHSITELDYDRLVDSPAEELQKLLDDGWPIEVDEAIRVPSSGLRHHHE